MSECAVTAHSLGSGMRVLARLQLQSRRRRHGEAEMVDTEPSQHLAKAAQGIFLTLV